MSGSPPPSATPLTPVVALLCCDALLNAGEADLVLGALTTMESVVDAAVFTLVVDPVPVRSANAARRGLGADVVLGWRGGAVPPLAAAALLLMRAAS